MPKWILPATLALFCWGIWGFIPKITTRYIHPVSAAVFEAVGVGIVGGIILLYWGPRLEIHPKGICLGITTGMLGILGALGFLFAVKMGKVSIIAVFTAMYPAITILLAYAFLKEPITVKESMGFLCAFAAIYFFSSK